MSYKYPNVSLLGYLILEPLQHMLSNPKNNAYFFDIDILKWRIKLEKKYKKKKKHDGVIKNLSTITKFVRI